MKKDEHLKEILDKDGYYQIYLKKQQFYQHQSINLTILKKNKKGF